MGKQSIFDRIRIAIGVLGFRIFLLANRLTEEQYINMVKEQSEVR